MNYLNNILANRNQPNAQPINNADIRGGGENEIANCSYGFSCIRGKRSSMEDFCEARFTEFEGTTIGLFGVFDGHGGPQAADYVKKHLFKNLVKHPKFLTDTKCALVETYKQTDKDFLSAEDGKYREAGSTASTAVLVGDHLLVANVGDSRVIVGKGGKAFALSTDHKASHRDERRRIEKAGGVVIWAGTWRVGGVLAVSRAFGDRLLKRFVIAEPEIHEEIINKYTDFVILASDGLWDVMSNQNAVTIVSSIPDAQEAARKLTEEALIRGSPDNITCIVLRFNHNVEEC